MSIFSEIKFSINDNPINSNKLEYISQSSTLEDVTKQIKNHIKINIENGLHSNALFFADKVNSIIKLSYFI